MQGWIKLQRKIRNNWIFDNAEYLRAWILILIEANHKPKKTLIKGKLIQCKEGQSLNSLETWGRIFGNWSKSKVSRFLKLLESDGMIKLENEKVTTRLSVCNYSTYQESQNDKRTDTERRRDTNKNEKNEKNDIGSDELSLDFDERPAKCTQGCKCGTKEKCTLKVENHTEWDIRYIAKLLELKDFDSQAYFLSRERSAWKMNNGKKVSSIESDMKLWRRKGWA